MDGLKMKYFVLSPESRDVNHSEASRMAIFAYAAAIRHANPTLANELRDWMVGLDFKDMERETPF